MKICRKCLIEKPVNEFHKDSQNKDGYKNTCKVCCKLQDKKFYERNTGLILEKQKKYRKLNRRRYTENEKIRSQSDPIFRLKKNLRNRVREYFKIIGEPKNNETFLLIGKTPEELRIYLDSLFTDGMSWDNYGKWHVDHIIPLNSATNENDLLKLIHYTNLQPLWAEDNLKKGSKIIF
jgi:hypothetical protein